MKRRIVLLGPPASGKGTQAELISETFGISVTSPGAALREEALAGSEIGRMAQQYTNQGRLLPDEVVIHLVGGWLDRHESEFVMDGFPRTIGQADGLARLLEARGLAVEAVLGLEADVATLQSRVQNRVVCSKCRRIFSVGLNVAAENAGCPPCGGKLERRADDTLEVLAERMREYTAKTEPLFAYYENLGLLTRIDSNRPPEVVFQAVRAILVGE